MIDISELATTLQNKLNTIANANSLDLHFSVKSYASFFDDRKKTYNSEDSDGDITTVNTNDIPVYIDMPEGDFEPIPNIELVSQTHNINFYFPLIKKAEIINFLNFLPSEFVGKIINIGTYSGNALCNLSAPTFSGVDIQNFNEFSEFLNNTYQKVIDQSEYYAIATLTIYTTSVKGLGTSSGFILGNEVKYGLYFEVNNKYYSIGYNSFYKGEINNVSDLPTSGTSAGDIYRIKTAFTYGGVEYPSNSYAKRGGSPFSWTYYLPTNMSLEENDLVWTSATKSQEGNLVSQQLLGETKTTSLINTTSYVSSIVVYAKNNTFFRQLYNYYLSGYYQNTPMNVIRTIYDGSETQYFIVVSIEEHINLGEVMTYTISFTYKASA